MQEGSVKTRKWLIELLTKLKSSGFTTLVMLDPKLHPPEELYAILTLFEGEISIREEETVEGMGRFLRVKRMKNQKFLKEEVPLTTEQQDQQNSQFKDLKSRGFMRLF